MPLVSQHDNTIMATFTLLFADGVQKQVDVEPLAILMKETLMAAHNPETVKKAYCADHNYSEALTDLFNKTEQQQVELYIRGFQRYCEQEHGAMIFDETDTPTETAVKLFHIVEWEALEYVLEEYCKMNRKHMCEWVSSRRVNGNWVQDDDCEEPAVYCKTFGLVYCSMHICESEGGSWCENMDCASCNEARRLDAIEAAKEEAEEEALNGPAPVY